MANNDNHNGNGTVNGTVNDKDKRRKQNNTDSKHHDVSNGKKCHSKPSLSQEGRNSDRGPCSELQPPYFIEPTITNGTNDYHQTRAGSNGRERERERQDPQLVTTQQPRNSKITSEESTQWRANKKRRHTNRSSLASILSLSPLLSATYFCCLSILTPRRTKSQSASLLRSIPCVSQTSFSASQLPYDRVPSQAP